MAFPRNFHMRTFRHRHHSFTPTRGDCRMLLRIGSRSFEINMWNPVYAIAPFALLSISIPLAIFATLTTSIAISLLSFRALIVYFQLAIAVIGAWLLPSSPKRATRYSPLPTSSSVRQSPTRPRRRRSSTASTLSSQDIAVPTTNTPRLFHKNNSLTALIGTSELTRDFEGVGGWRDPGDNDEEALWMGINSRLQLPAETPTRRHRRSLTGGASPSQRWSFSPEAFRMSPVQSRARTPLRFAVDDECGYFPVQPMSTNRRSSTASEQSKQLIRRKSGSSTSTSSVASVGFAMAVKEAGE